MLHLCESSQVKVAKAEMIGVYMRIKFSLESTVISKMTIEKNVFKFD